MAIRVMKFGGSCVSTAEKICSVADRIIRSAKKDDKVIVVVSAMGSTTDELAALANKVCNIPNRRELDMLLSTGERVSMSLLSMALNSRGVNSISFTGSQAGVMTDSTHNNARITDVKPIRIQEELSKNKVVVLAGFQGVNPLTKEITTLGRGGSDTTAVAMSSFFGAKCCEIYKDVEGVYSSDPRHSKNAIKYSKLNFDNMCEFTFWGAQVLHNRSVELAKSLKIPIQISLAHEDRPGTLICGDEDMFETQKLIGINTHDKVFSFKANGSNPSEILNSIDEVLKTHNLPWPQILSLIASNKDHIIYLTGPKELMDSFQELSKNILRLESDELSSVAFTSHGSVSTDLPKNMLNQLKENGINVIHSIFSAQTFALIINRSQLSSVTNLSGSLFS